MKRRRYVQHVRSTLSRILLCRTPILRGHVFECTGCGSKTVVYNSCGDRNCPQCSGARRADWLDKTAELILPGMNYFQVIFTLPDKLSPLILGNRTILYNLLFRSAWKALAKCIRDEQGFQPAAVMVLHT